MHQNRTIDENQLRNSGGQHAQDGRIGQPQCQYIGPDQSPAVQIDEHKIGRAIQLIVPDLQRSQYGRNCNTQIKDKVDQAMEIREITDIKHIQPPNGWSGHRSPCHPQTIDQQKNP